MFTRLAFDVQFVQRLGIAVLTNGVVTWRRYVQWKVHLKGEFQRCIPCEHNMWYHCRTRIRGLLLAKTSTCFYVFLSPRSGANSVSQKTIFRQHLHFRWLIKNIMMMLAMFASHALCAGTMLFQWSHAEAKDTVNIDTERYRVKQSETLNLFNEIIYNMH